MLIFNWRPVPPSLRVKPLALSFIDPGYLILSRLNIKLMYLKCLCVLHRKYLSHDRANPKFDYSRKTCTEASLQILKYQAELQTACQPGGQFYNDKWMLSSLTLNDFLLAAMITCLDLYESQSKPGTSSPDSLKAQIEKYDALRVSHGIWMSRRAYSRDARRVSNVLAMMLSKVPDPNRASATVNTLLEMSRMSPPSLNGGDIMGTIANSSGSSSNLTGLDTPDHDSSVDSHAPMDLDFTNPFDTIFGESEDIDWVSLGNP